MKTRFQERNQKIFEKYDSAPKHLKGTFIKKIMNEYELSRSQVYLIVQQQKAKKNSKNTPKKSIVF